MSRGWRRLLALACALALAAGTLLVLNVTVWAQEQQEQPTGAEQPTATEQPAETQQQPVGTEQQQQQQQQPQDGLVIDYWEPEVGTRTVYRINDFMNDIHGNVHGTSWLGYIDASWLYQYTLASNLYPVGINYASSYYYNVTAISDMNRVYFDMQGPWYFNMTTPYKLVMEVKGIHEVPDAHLFPSATYAVNVLYICSGGHRLELTSYRSNDANEKAWKEWGFVVTESYPRGAYEPRREVVRYRSPSDHSVSAPSVIMTFPLKVGDTGSSDSVYMEGDGFGALSSAAGFEVVAEGKMTVPGGAGLDALLVRFNVTGIGNGAPYSRIAYEWVVPGIGAVVHTDSLPNVLGPTYGETSDYECRNEDYVNAMSLMVLESSTALPGGK